MYFFVDVCGVSIRASAERLDHALLHRELAGREDLIGLTLSEPDVGVSSLRDPSVRIYDRR
jgi:hypothetical protein